MIQFILGGARSGKSGYAEEQAGTSGNGVIYFATAQPDDDEMTQRIEQHQRRRPRSWRLVEAPVHLADALMRYDNEDCCLLVDCLTLWLSNLLCREEGDVFDRQRQKLVDTLPRLQGDLILVSNEVGQGIVPLGDDRVDRMHQSGGAGD